MKKNRFVVLLLIAVVLVSAVGIASAQGFGRAAPNGQARGIGMLGLGRQVLAATELTVQELHDKLAAGMTFEQVLIEANVDVETFKADVIADVTARINAAVESGRLTQEQADTWLAKVTENLDAALTQTHEMMAAHPFMGRMDRGMRGMHGMHGRGMDGLGNMGKGFGWMNPNVPEPVTTPESADSL